MLVKLLRQYFDGFHWCEYYTPEDCCKQIPCVRPDVCLQKNHDFKLETPITERHPYIVQYRNPVMSAISDLELLQSRHKGTYSPQYWYAYALQRRNFWVSFLRKWFVEAPNAEVVYVPYEEFMAAPLLSLTRIVRFLSPKQPVDMERLERAIQYAPVCQRRAAADFEYFDPLFFHLIEESVSEYMAMVGTPSCLTPVSDELFGILSSPPGERSLNLAYLALLGRFPKMYDLAEPKKRYGSVSQMIEALKASREFRDNISKTRTYNDTAVEIPSRNARILVGAA